MREISIGRLAERTGLAVSAIRFYEDKGLLKSERNRGGQRRFRPVDIRRLSFVMIAQKLGFSLKDIRGFMSDLPLERAPSKAEWARMAEGMQDDITARIATLERLRDTLDGCIGCGCLSMEACALYNPEDSAAARGVGPRYLMGDTEPQ